MKLIIQRVSQAEVKVKHKTVGKIAYGHLVFLGIHRDDNEKKADILVKKLLNLRIMPDENKKMNRSVVDIRGNILVVSQFTLYADTSSRRPGFTKAAKPNKAKKLYNYFLQKLKEGGLKIVSGEFSSYMKVSLINDGPVTITLEV